MTSGRGSSAPSARVQREPDTSSSDASLYRVFNRDVAKERILAAAITAVAERGFGGLTVKEVARIAGIKAPGLYSHFPSREAILTEAVSRVLADFMDRMSTIPEASPEEALRETVRRHVLYQIDNMQIAQVADLVLNTATAGHFLPSEDYDLLLSVQHEHLTLVHTRVAAFAPKLSKAEAEVAAMAIVAMCDRVPNWFRSEGAFDREGIADLHWRLARAMLEN